MRSSYRSRRPLSRHGGQADTSSSARTSSARSSGRDSRWSPSLISVSDHVVAGRWLDEPHRVTPRHVGVLPCPAGCGPGSPSRSAAASSRWLRPSSIRPRGDRVGLVGVVRSARGARRPRSDHRPHAGRHSAHIRASVKSTAGAISTRPRWPARRCQRARGEQSAIQPPIDEPTRTGRPASAASRTACASSSQREMVPSSNRPPELAVAGIVEAQQGPAALRSPQASSAAALVAPCRSGSRRTRRPSGRRRRDGANAMARRSSPVTDVEKLQFAVLSPSTSTCTGMPAGMPGRAVWPP